MPATWLAGWLTGDVVSAAEFAKGIGCISNTTLGADAASVDVTSIPGSYAHLLIIAYLRSSTAAVSTTLVCRFNADSGANYSMVDTANTDAATYIGTSAQGVPGANSDASAFNAVAILVPHYAGTSMHKSAVLFNGQHSKSADATARHNGVAAGRWKSASAITRVTISAGAGNLVTGSRVGIYVMGS